MKEGKPMKSIRNIIFSDHILEDTSEYQVFMVKADENAKLEKDMSDLRATGAENMDQLEKRIQLLQDYLKSPRRIICYKCKWAS